MIILFKIWSHKSKKTWWKEVKGGMNASCFVWKMAGLTAIFLHLIIGVIMVSSLKNGLLNEHREIEICLFSSKEILQRRRHHIFNIISSFHVCFENIQVGRSVKSFVEKFKIWPTLGPDAYKIFPCGKYYSANTVKHRSNAETIKIFEKMWWSTLLWRHLWHWLLRSFGFDKVYFMDHD